jgi:hypothetical protein
MSDEVLGQFVGSYDAEITVRPGPDAAPVKQTGASTVTLLAGRWLVVDYRSDSGFEGHGVYGWDEAQRRYTGVWVDSMMPGIARSEGSWNASTRTLDLATESVQEGRTVRCREQRQIAEDGTQIYRNLLPLPDGSELEVVRVVYRRR